MDILYLVDRLENLVAASRRMPLLNQAIIKEGDLLAIIDLMRTSIPEEIKQARRITQEKERILAHAQAEARNIMMRAQHEAERIMSREGLLQVAEERSQVIIRQAGEHAQNMVRQAEEHTERLQSEADAYAAETLRNLREHLMNVGTEVERTILSIERGLESLEEQPGEEHNQDDQLGEGNGGEPTHHVPRRASLAADTMGGPIL